MNYTYVVTYKSTSIIPSEWITQVFSWPNFNCFYTVLNSNFGIGNWVILNIYRE